jgi:hypothetical protein
MTTQQKANCTKYYNKFFDQNCNDLYIDKLTKNVFGQPWFEFRLKKESQRDIINILTRDKWKVYGSTINKSRFFAVYTNE